MSIEEKIQLIEKGTLEVIDAEELKEVLKKEQPIAYTGYEPVSYTHLDVYKRQQNGPFNPGATSFLALSTNLSAISNT